MKKKIIIGLIILCLILIIEGMIIVRKNSSTLPQKEEPTQEATYNTNQKVVEDKNINNITFTNIECLYDGNNSLLSYTITNKTKNSIILGEYEIIVKDKNGTILANLAPRLDEELAAGESFDTGTSVNIDLSKAYEIELVINNEG